MKTFGQRGKITRNSRMNKGSAAQWFKGLIYEFQKGAAAGGGGTRVNKGKGTGGKGRLDRPETSTHIIKKGKLPNHNVLRKKVATQENHNKQWLEPRGQEVFSFWGGKKAKKPQRKGESYSKVVPCLK